jgi:multiple antibiotic resistance protein
VPARPLNPPAPAPELPPVPAPLPAVQAQTASVRSAWQTCAPVRPSVQVQAMLAPTMHDGFELLDPQPTTTARITAAPTKTTARIARPFRLRRKRSSPRDSASERRAVSAGSSPPADYDRAVLGQILSFTFSTVTTLLLVVDAPAAVPLFLSMTETDSAEHQRRTAFRAALAAGIVLASFGAVGGLIFRVLGISLGAFRIAGGVLLFLLAIDMLRAQRSRQRTSPEEEAEGLDRPDVSIFPLAIPMLAGPGATSTVMVLVSRAERVWQYIVVFGAILLTGFVSYGLLRGALRVERRLGRTGMNVLQRVMGLILAATAVQFVVEGVSNVLPTMVAGLRGG